MSLRTELSSRLDASSFADTLLTAVTSAVGSLSGIALPVDAGTSGEASTQSEGIRADGIGGAASAVAGQLLPALSALPSAESALAPILNTLSLVERVASGDWVQRLSTLRSRLDGQMQADRQRGSWLDAVLGALSGQSPELAELLSVIQSFAALGGVGPQVFQSPALDVAPALAHGVKLFGGLATLEGELEQAARLAALMEHSTSAAGFAGRLASIEILLAPGPESLASRIADLAANPEGAEAVAIALDRLSAQVGALQDETRASLGFGEATLAYIAPDPLLARLQAAAAAVRNADLAPLERLLSQTAQWFSPLARIDLNIAPLESLDALLGQVEGKITELSNEITQFDAAAALRPLTDGLGAVTQVLGGFRDAVEGFVGTIRGALERVREAIAALPLQDIERAVQGVVEQVAQALQFVSGIVQGVQGLLDGIATTATTAITTAETALNTFQTAVENAFDQAADFVEGLDLSGKVGQLAGAVQGFAAEVSKADMSPVFDTASRAIDTAAQVVDAVPFELLPDSMEQDVQEAIRPVKQVDADAVKARIEATLGITEDGRFGPRDALEAAVAEIQAKFEKLIKTMEEEVNLPALADRINIELQKLAAKVRQVVPAVALEPVQTAIDTVKGAVASIDLNALLEPVRGAFSQALAAIDAYSPSQLIAPLETRLDQARTQLTDAVRLAEWRPWVEQLAASAKRVIDWADPAQLAPRLQAAVDELMALVARLPDVSPMAGLGHLVSALLSGSGMSAPTSAFQALVGWLSNPSGAQVLSARARSFADSINATLAHARAADVEAASARLLPLLRGLTEAAAALPAGEARAAVEARLAALDPVSLLAPLSAGRARFVSSLEAALSGAQSLANTGFSEATEAVSRLARAFSPLSALRQAADGLLRKLGLGGLDGGLRGMLLGLLEVAGPARLSGILTPLFVALRGRAESVIDAIAAPVLASIDELTGLIAAFDLTPLREGVDAVVAEVKAPIEAMSPDVALAPALTAFSDTQAAVAAFDPLAPLETVLNGLRDAATRVLGRLDAHRLLEGPLRIWNEILEALRALDAQAILQPVFDLLDSLAQQVDEGLDQTTESFKRLQAALPG